MSQTAVNTPASWTIERMLNWGTDYLKRSGSPSARLDTQLLIGHVCGLDKVQLYVQFERPLQPDELDALRALFKRRAGHEPVAYILGTKAFYGRDYDVDTTVLIPRPETEHLVDAVTEYLDEKDIEAPNIVDVGTGSGCITVTLAAEWSGALVLGVDISADALRMAAHNADKHAVRERVKLTQGHLLEPVQTQASVDVIVSNPPYLDAPLMESLMADVRDYEPTTALDGGRDGLDLIRPLIDDSARVLKPGGLLAMEIAHDAQAAAVQALLEEHPAFSTRQTIPDYAGIARVVTATRNDS